MGEYYCVNNIETEKWGKLSIKEKDDYFLLKKGDIVLIKDIDYISKDIYIFRNNILVKDIHFMGIFDNLFQLIDKTTMDIIQIVPKRAMSNYLITDITKQIKRVNKLKDLLNEGKM